ncbi:hypothetical protein V8G54_005528, partial [Vigna mungo]
KQYKKEKILICIRISACIIQDVLKGNPSNSSFANKLPNKNRRKNKKYTISKQYFLFSKIAQEFNTRKANSSFWTPHSIKLAIATFLFLGKQILTYISKRANEQMMNQNQTNINNMPLLILVHQCLEHIYAVNMTIERN